jgi:hypothetical protein
MAASNLAKAFFKAFGKASPAAPAGLQFVSPGMQRLWLGIYKELGAGWYKDGFLYLFGEGLDALLPCLEAWSFLVPAAKNPLIIGRNAYGALLVTLDSAADNPRIGVVDPTRVAWVSNPNIDLGGLLGAWLPEGLLPHFVDDEPYQAWRRAGGKRLAVNEMLAPETPVALGGTMDPDDLKVTDIITYYQVSGPVFAKAGKTKRGGKKRNK